MAKIIRLTLAQLRPPSLPGGPAWVERSSVSGVRAVWLGKTVLIVAGAVALAIGAGWLLAEDVQGFRLLLLGIGLGAWGFAQPLRFAVNLHRRGSVRRLLVTHDAGFAARVAQVINAGLADPAAMPVYYLDVKNRRIMTDPA